MENIISIQSFATFNRIVEVQAIVDNVKRLSHQTLYDKEEYGPALCYAEIVLADEQTVPEHEQDVLDLISNYCIDWSIIDDE